MSALLKWIPLLRDLRDYRREWLSRDVIAGISVAAVQVPTAVAYAQLAGFSPEVGLYASLLPVLIYALFGSSRQLVVGPDAATCAMVAALLLPLAGGDPATYVAYSAALAITAGLLMVVGGAAGLGFIVNFFAKPILVGFLNGIALSIIAGQLGKLAGVALENRDFGPSIRELLLRVDEIHWLTVGVGFATLALLIALHRVAPRAPAALIALVIAGVAVFALGSAGDSIKVVGSVPSGLPSLQLPGLGYEGVQHVFMGAIGLVIISFTSTMLTARSFSTRNGYTIDANQEMRALGFANIAAGVSGGFAVAGADSRTAVNDATGGKTQLVSVVAALATGAVAVFLAAPLGHLPMAALAAVLIFSAWGLLDIGAYRQLRAIDRFEFGISVFTTIGVLTIGVLPGVILAIVLALIQVLLKIYRPPDAVLGIVPGLDGYNDIRLAPDAKTLPDIILYRFDAPLLFFNAEHFTERVRSLVKNSATPPRWFVFDAEAVSQIDSTGIQAIDDVLKELGAMGVRFLVARPNDAVRRYGHTSGVGLRIGAENIFASVRSAVDAIHLRADTKNPAHASGVNHDYSYRSFLTQHGVDERGER